MHALSIAWGVALHLVRFVSESVSHGLVFVSAVAGSRAKLAAEVVALRTHHPAQPITRSTGGGAGMLMSVIRKDRPKGRSAPARKGAAMRFGPSCCVEDD